MWPCVIRRPRRRCASGAICCSNQLPKLPESQQPADDLAAIREAAKVQGGATKNTWGNAAAFERFRDAAKALREAIDAGRAANAVRRGGGPARRRQLPCNCSAWPPIWPRNTTGRNGSWAFWTSTIC